MIYQKPPTIYILFYLFLIASGLSQAALITLDNNCSIIQAIEAANTNNPVGQCIAGDDAGGSDSILMTADIVLTQFAENDASFGRTGTPRVISNIIIEGNGYSLERDASLACILNSTDEAGEFRLLRVASPGNLIVRNLILKNGCADSSGGVDKKIGGAILNFAATLTVSNVIIKGNKAEFRGGGIDTTFGSSTITNTFFTNNETNFGGAALSNFTSNTGISNSTLANNTAGNRGGAIWNIDGAGGIQNSTLTLINNTLSANTSNVDGGAIYNENAIIINSLNNTLSGNQANNSASAIYNAATGQIDIISFLFSNNGGGLDECLNDGGTFTSNIGMTDHAPGGCSTIESAQINLLPLADNGCMTPLADGTCIKTHGLGLGSHAINPAQALIGIDQRGFVNVDIRRDIGAYESLSGGQQCNQVGIVISDDSIAGFSAEVSNSYQLNQAITCANLDDQTADNIDLVADINLNKQYIPNDGKGATGTVLIKTPMIIDGKKNSLQRDLNFICTVDNVETNTEFRLLKVTQTGILNLKNIRLENGCVDSDSSISRGAGILNNGMLAISHSSIRNNQADFGAGISNARTSGGIEPIISILDSLVISNNIAGFSGGGIENTLATITMIQNSIIKDNYVTSINNAKGAGIYNDSTSSISNIVNTSITGNTSSFDGGGIYNNSQITHIIKSTIANNEASNEGGGIYNVGALGLILHSTLSANKAINGGAAYNSGSLQDIKHTTFSTNDASSEGAAIYTVGGLSQLNNSLFHGNIGTNANCRAVGSGDVQGDSNISNSIGGSNNCSVNIATSLDFNTVGDLADNGCKDVLADGSCTKTHALMSTSEAINFINATNENKDQRSFIVEDGLRDAGAFEFLTTDQQCIQTSINISSSFTQSVNNANDLRQAINCANANIETTDNIHLGDDILLPQVFENIDTGIFQDIASKGRTGTPAITSPLIINGMGFILMRDTNLTCGSLSGSAPEDPERFRLLRITDMGSLELSHIILANGCVSQNSQIHKFYGGGIYNQGNLSVTDSVFSKNGAATGAGIYNYQGTVSQISNSIFEQNDVPDFFGAGLANDDGQITSIKNNAFIQNNAFFGGGGIANANNGTITTIARNTFDKNNSAFIGAGLYNLSGAVINNIENNTFSGNTGSSGVGNESLISNISNSTFVNNDFGIHNDAGTISSINNSVIDACLNQNGGSINGSNNLSDDINHSCPGTTLTFNLNINTNMEDNRCVNKLADNTCVQTHALLTGSDAIDQGNNNATSIDQRGFEPLGIRDIGAFEFASPTADIIFNNGFED
jgi:hypothetical protein